MLPSLTVAFSQSISTTGLLTISPEITFVISSIESSSIFIISVLSNPANSLANSSELFPGMAFKVAHRFYDEGLDFWGVCLFYGDPCPLTGEAIETPETPEEFRVRRCEILGNIFQKSFDKGNFVIPTGFADGIDYKTEVLYRDADRLDENYYIMCGFPGIMSPSFEDFSPVERNPTPLNQHFMEYIKIAMRYTKAEYEEMWPSATYKLIHEKRKFVIDYIKNTYNVDLEKIAELIGE